MKVVIDGVTIDDETGEIIDFKGDALAWAVQTYQNAKLNIKGWEQTQALAKQAMDRLLTDADEKRIKTDYGTAGIRAGRETIDNNGLKEAVKVAELTVNDQLHFFYTCAATFTPSRVKEWAFDQGMGDLIRDFMRQGAPYVQVDPPKGLPPKIESAS